MRDHRLTLTITAAVLVLVGTSTALLVFDPRVTSADALRTGGLAAGSVVALYALWLNDRRRRVEEHRQELERRQQELDRERYALEERRQELEHRRSDHDRERAADERFARAIELLGHETDQVRVGALHSLAGLARSYHDHTQTVLDVLCSYLRRPFAHPRYADEVPADSAGRETEWTSPARDDAERKLVVRLTAQRLLAQLLPTSTQQDAPAYDLDLTGACLEYFDLSERKIGALVLRYARLYSSTSFNRCEIHGPAWFTGATTGSGRLPGRFHCSDARFHDRAWFSKVRFHDFAEFNRTRFLGPVKFAGSVLNKDILFHDASFHSELDLRYAHFDGHLDFRIREPMPGLSLYNTTVETSNAVVQAANEILLPDHWRLEPMPDSTRARIHAGMS